jgi:hypothetical protein
MKPRAERSAVDLQEHTALQVVVFALLSMLFSVGVFVLVATPTLESFFATFLHSSVVRDGQHVQYSIGEQRPEQTVKTSPYGTWALVDPRAMEKRSQKELFPKEAPISADYVFKPLVALSPIVVVFGIALAALLGLLLPATVGLLHQKVHREILTMLDAMLRAPGAPHLQLHQVEKALLQADIRQLHALADTYSMQYADVYLLAQALRWQNTRGFGKLFLCHGAIKFYMREHFTTQYSNAVLGCVYIGAAVLIIVIGIRGLKFIPASDPSIVLGALGLEFMLLVTYAVMLLYGKPEDEQPLMATVQPIQPANVQEQLVRALLYIKRQGNGSA